jgi:hypothetical protein
MLKMLLSKVIDLYISIENLINSKFVCYIEEDKIYNYPLSKFVPLIFYKPFLTDKVYMYKVNNNYYISNDELLINPIINTIYLSNDDNKIDITDRFKNYSSSILLKHVLYIENLTEYDNITIIVDKIFNKHTYIYNINEVNNYSLYNLYNNKI